MTGAKAADKPIKPEQDVISDMERERLRQHIARTDMEKFQLFVQMLRRSAMLKQAKITHK